MSVTIKDIARAAHVSVATVSYVCTGKRKVSRELEKRVLDAIRKLEYRPNAAARALRSGRTHMLGILVPHYSSAYYSSILQGVQDTAFQRGYIVCTYETRHDLPTEKAILRILEEARVDGMVVVSQTGILMQQREGTVPEIERLLNGIRPIPIVAIETESDLPGVDSVVLDEERAGHMACSHLLELGHRHIGCLAGPSQLNSSRARLRGYRAALEDAGLPFRSAYIRQGQNTAEFGALGLYELIRVDRRITGIVASDDRVAFGALSAALDAGLKVPQDLAVISHENSFLAARTRPSLTGFTVPAFRMGQFACGRLIDRIERSLRDRSIIRIPITLVPRTSTIGSP